MAGLRPRFWTKAGAACGIPAAVLVLVVEELYHSPSSGQIVTGDDFGGSFSTLPPMVLLGGQVAFVAAVLLAAFVASLAFTLRQREGVRPGPWLFVPAGGGAFVLLLGLGHLDRFGLDRAVVRYLLAQDSGAIAMYNETQNRYWSFFRTSNPQRLLDKARGWWVEVVQTAEGWEPQLW